MAGDDAFGIDTGCPVSNPLAPIHADPVARALGPGANRNRPRWVQLGRPQILRLHTTTPSLTDHPKVPGELVRLTVTIPVGESPHPRRTLQQVSVSLDHPKVIASPV